MTILGYASGSADEPLWDQRAALEKAGCEQIFEDANLERGQRLGLRAAINAASEGDALFVTRLSRLAGSVEDVHATAVNLTSRKIGLKTLDHPAFDTRALEFDTLLTTLSTLSGLERDLRRARRREVADVKNGHRAGLTPGAIAERAGIPVSRVYSALGWITAGDAFTLDDVLKGVRPCEVFRSLVSFDQDISNYEIALDFIDCFERCDGIAVQHIWHWGAGQRSGGGYTDRELDELLTDELERAGYLSVKLEL